MKAILILSFVALVSRSQSLETTDRKYNFGAASGHVRNELLSNLAGTISDLFIHKLIAKNTRDPVIPELPDPLPIETLELDLAELGLGDVAAGQVALRNGEMTGGSSIMDDLSLELLIPAKMVYDFKSGHIEVIGEYEADAQINFIYIIPIKGSGNLRANITNLAYNVDIRALINLITNKIQVQTVAIDVVFDAVYTYAEGLRMCDEIVDWDSVNQDAKPVFDEFWALNKAEIEILVRDILRDLLKDCTLTEIIGGDFSCLGLGPAPAPVRSLKISDLSRAFINYFAPAFAPRLTCELAPTTTTTTPTTTTTEDPYCSENNPCPTGSYCEEYDFGTYCVCEDQLYSIQWSHNPNNIECRRVAGTSCILSAADPNYQSCVPNAVCLASNGTHGRCECQTGFVVNERGNCGADFGQACGSNNGIECSSDFSLTCRRGQCQCASPELVFEAGRGCVATIGQPCNIHSQIEHSHRLECQSGFKCIRLVSGRHVCQPGSDIYVSEM